MVSKSNFNMLLDDPANQALVPIALRRAMLGDRLLAEQLGSWSRREGEDFLKICVEQLDWIKAAETSLLDLLHDPQHEGPGIGSEIVGSMLRAIRELYEAWHAASEKVTLLLAQFSKNGMEIDRRSTFAKAKQYAELRVTQYANEDFIYEDLDLGGEGTETRILLD